MSSSVEPGQVNPDAFGVGRLAQSLVASYFAHTAAIRVARHPQAYLLLPAVEPDELVPIARVRQKDGGEFSFHFAHYLDAAQSEDQDAFERVFLAGALLNLREGAVDHFAGEVRASPFGIGRRLALGEVSIRAPLHRSV